MTPRRTPTGASQWRDEWQHLLDAGRDAVLITDARGLPIAVNTEAVRLLGWTERDLCQQPITQFIPERFHRVVELWPVRAEDDARAAHAAQHTISLFARRRDGTEFPVEITRRPIGAEGAALHLITLRDISVTRHLQEGLLREKEVAMLTLDSIGDGVLTTDLAGRVVYLNPVAERLTGWRMSQAVGQPVERVMPLIADVTRLSVEGPVTRCLREERAVDLQEGLLLVRRDGTEMPIGDSVAPIHERNGTAAGVVLVFHDASERRRVSRALVHDASHDPLTGVSNRAGFERQLARVLAEVAATDGATTDDDPPQHALCYFDLDRFKAVNDVAGHAAGDELLRQVVGLLRAQMRRRDTLARMGGDEFVALLEHCDLDEAERIAAACCTAVGAFVLEWQAHRCTVGVSVGVVPIARGSERSVVLLRAADAACYAAKRAGGGRVHLEEGSAGDPPPTDDLEARRATRLVQAVELGQVVLHAQPIMALQPAQSARARYEILMRQPNDGGRTPPSRATQQETGHAPHLPNLDRWVTERTLTLLAQWRRGHLGVEWPMCLLHLSPTSLGDEALLPALTRGLGTTEVPPGVLCFEIAEAAVLGNLPDAVRLVAALRDLGCGVALGEFGNSLDSFAHLKVLPVDYLKLSGHHVRGITADPVYGNIIGAVTEICAASGIATIAEHVDREDVLHRLRALGVDFVQGEAVAATLPLLDLDGSVMLPSVRLQA